MDMSQVFCIENTAYFSQYSLEAHVCVLSLIFAYLSEHSLIFR